MRYSSDIGRGQRSLVDFYFFSLICFVFKLTHRIQASSNTVINASSLHKHNSRFGRGIPLGLAKKQFPPLQFCNYDRNFCFRSPNTQQMFFLSQYDTREKKALYYSSLYVFYFYLQMTLHYIFTNRW